MSERRSSLVSVIVCVYNGQDTVCQAIDSVLDQTYPEREIVVVDDGSTDSSLELLRGYGRRVQLVQQKHSGLSIARNTGLSAARGEYIAFLDCDDTWIPEKLQLQVEILNKHPSVGLTFGNLEYVDKKGEKLGSTALNSNYRYSPSWEDLLMWFSIKPSSLMARKELMTKVGGWDSDFITPGYEDKNFLLRLREITDFHYLDVSLGCYFFDEARTCSRAWYQSNLLLYARKQWSNPRLQMRANDRLRDEFVATCASHLSYYAKVLLKIEQNKVSKEMLRRLNEFHDTFKRIFGESYKRVSHLDSIDLTKYELTPGISLLLYLYLCRPDLQSAMPEVSSGDLSRLVHWAIAVAKGAYIDSDKPILLTHITELERLKQKRTSYIHAFMKRQIRHVFLADSSA